MPNSIKELLKLESSAAVVLFLSAVGAILIANSPLRSDYHSLLNAHLGFLSLEGWVNDGLMAIFFFYVGMEIKSEMTEGSLASFDRAFLPIAGALGGMLVPAVIYLFFVQDRGWGIPIATDIAFAIAALNLCGKKIRPELKVFLLALAIADDLGAVVVIAFFYTETISVPFLAAACGTLLLAFGLIRAKLSSPWIHVPVGIAIWFLVYKSGVHASVAGALLGFLVPSPEAWIKRLHGLSSFFIMPIFAFANAGLSLTDVTLAEALTNPIVNAVGFGLFIGKPVGIFAASWLAVRTGLARLDFRWRELIGVACLGGIGFSVSLFINNLAFKDLHALELAKLGIVKGSLLSAILGCFVLIYFARPDRKA